MKYIDPDGMEILPVGNAGLIKQINTGLAIIAKTNPELYKSLKEAKEIYRIGVAELNERVINTTTGASSSISFSATETIDNQGFYNSSLSSGRALKDEDSSADGTKFSAGTNSGGREFITEQEANDLIKISDATITIDENLGKKDFAKILSHEFGHANYELKNKAKAWSRPDDGKKGHGKGNPSGQAADNAEKEFKKNYSDLKRNGDL